MPTTYNDPIMLDSTGQDIVDKLDSIASLMGDGVIDDTSTVATDKTWSINKISEVDNKLQNGVIANTQLIADTVGFSAKNKFKYNRVTVAGSEKTFPFTANGITFTKNVDGSITVGGGTASANTQAFLWLDGTIKAGEYTLNGCPSGGGTGKYDVRTENTLIDSGNGVNITLASDVGSTFNVILTVYNGCNLTTPITFKPMIRDADILDPTYEPYFGSTAFPRSEQAVLGAWNMLNTPYVDNGRTIDTVTLVEGTGGTISFSGGVASTTCDFVLHRRALDEPHPLYLPYGKYKYKLNSSASGFSILVGTTYNGAYKDIGGTWTTGEYIFEINANTQSDFKLSDGSVLCSPHIGVVQGTDTTDIVLKPTIELIEAPTDFIPPYAMTNRELTENNAVKNLVITPSSGITIDTGSYAKIRNGILNAYISLKSESEDITAFTELARIDGISGANDELFNFAGVNTTANSVVVCYCPFIKATGRIAIQTRTNVTANQTVNVAITAILE